MRKFRFIPAVLIALIATTSCVESSKKYQRLMSERDALKVVEEQYAYTLEMLNEVEEGFEAINQIEGSVALQLNSAENQPKAKKEIIAYQFNQVKSVIEENKAKIEELEQKLAALGKSNRTLNNTLARLQTKLEEKEAILVELQKELENKNIKIDELTKDVANLNETLQNTIAQATEYATKQQQQISEQDANLHKVYYVVGTKKELKEQNILSGNGLFKGKTIMDKDLNNNLFNHEDMRKLEKINISSRNPKVLSSHPQGSYTLNQADDKNVTLEIIEPEKFWSVTKYLVIQK